LVFRSLVLDPLSEIRTRTPAAESVKPVRPRSSRSGESPERRPSVRVAQGEQQESSSCKRVPSADGSKCARCTTAGAVPMASRRSRQRATHWTSASSAESRRTIELAGDASVRSVQSVQTPDCVSTCDALTSSSISVTHARVALRGCPLEPVSGRARKAFGRPSFLVVRGDAKALSRSPCREPERFDQGRSRRRPIR
jgi:hypothetical protein